MTYGSGVSTSPVMGSGGLDESFYGEQTRSGLFDDDESEYNFDVSGHDTLTGLPSDIADKIALVVGVILLIVGLALAIFEAYLIAVPLIVLGAGNIVCGAIGQGDISSMITLIVGAAFSIGAGAYYGDYGYYQYELYYQPPAIRVF